MRVGRVAGRVAALALGAGLGVWPGGPASLSAQASAGGGVQQVLKSSGPEPAAAAKPEESEIPELPGIEELVPRALAVEAEAGEATTQAARLGGTETAAGEIAKLEPEARRLVREMEAGGAETAALATGIASLQGRLDRVSDDVRKKLRDLEELRSRWRGRRDLWSAWRDRLVAEERPALAQEAETGLGRIAAVLTSADAAVDRVIEVQRRLEAVRRIVDDLIERAGTRGGLETRDGRDAPPLGSRLHRDQLREGLLGPVVRGIRALAWPGSEFWARHYGALALQILLGLGILLLARTFRGWSRLGEEWTGILGHPWALGIFVATLPSHLLYELPPPLWRLALWTLFAASSMVLAAVTFASPAKRRAVYGVAGVFTLLRVAEVVGLPAAWLRVLVAAIAGAGVVLLLIASRRAGREEQDRRGFRLLVRISAALLAGVLIAEVLGYDALARSLLQSALATAFGVLVVTLVLRLGRGAIQGAVARSAGRFPVLRRVGHRLSVRLGWLFQALVLLAAGVEIAVLWGLSDSPSEAFAALWSWDLGLGLGQLRLGQVLLALLALYGAVLLSTVLRSTVEGEVLAQRELDPGVSNAITTLLHYLLVTVGFFVALSLLGVDLDNLTLVVGALGVGVGLGLQDLVKNFFSGLVLLFERPVRVGDVVILGGEWATVKKIGLRATTVTTFDRSDLIVPNGDLTSQRVTNWTLSDQVSRLTVSVGVAYGSDLENVFELLQAVAAEHPQVLEDPPPAVLFVGFGDSSLDFELRVWVGAMEHRLPTRSELHAAIDRRFREAGISIPFPQRDLWVKSLPTPEEPPREPGRKRVREAVRSPADPDGETTKEANG